MDNIKAIITKLKNNNKLKSTITEDDLNIILDQINTYNIELETQNKQLIEKEKKLQEKNDKYKYLFNLSPIAFLEIDKNNNIIKWNNQAAKLFNQNDNLCIPSIKFDNFLSKEHLEKYFKIIDNLDNSNKEILRETIEFSIKDKVIDTLTTISKKNSNSNYLITIEEITEEKALKYSKTYLDNIFYNSPNIEIVTTGESIDKANKAMLDFVEYETLYDFKKEHNCICDYFLEEKELLQANMNGQTWLEYIVSNSSKDHKVAMEKNDKRYYFKVTISEIGFDENDRYKIVFTDITEHENLKRRLQYALEGSKDGLFDFEPATNKIYFSPRWKEIIGYKDDEIKNDFKEWEKRVEPNDLKNTLKDFDDYLKGKTLIYKNIHRMKHKDGSWKYILARGTFSEDKQRVVGTHTDITELVEVEKELNKSKEYLEDIFDINPNITFMTNGEELLKANKSFLEFTGFESINKFKEEYDCICDMFEDQDSYITKFIDGKLWVEYIYESKRNDYQALIIKDNKNFIFEISVEKLEKEYLVSLYDVSLLIEKDKLLIMQSRSAAMGDMINMIAHQWRQPLAVLSMDANNMLADYELKMFEGENYKAYANNILKQTQYLSNTIDDFRNFFKPHSTKEYVSIEKIIDNTLEFMNKSLENHNIEVIKEYKAFDEIEIYSNELSHVIINLIKNSKEALQQKITNNRKIYIRTYKKDSLILEVEDTAGGIDKKIIDKVFDPYFSTKEKLNGTGLGLYMNKMIVEDHFKGNIEVSNTNLGAKFVVKIPLKIDN